jgi:cellulose synthase (UDP-forming)
MSLPREDHARRRQWGADKRTAPLPPVAAPVSDTLITLGRLGIVLTLIAWGAYILVTVLSQFVNRGFQGMRFTSETVSYVVIMSFLTFSSLMYLIARQGSLYRTRAHRRAARADRRLVRHLAAHDDRAGAFLS